MDIAPEPTNVIYLILLTSNDLYVKLVSNFFSDTDKTPTFAIATQSRGEGGLRDVARTLKQGCLSSSLISYKKRT